MRDSALAFGLLLVPAAAGAHHGVAGLGAAGLEGPGAPIEAATGGDILYALPGLRLYWDSFSVGLGVKTPVWTDLNEEAEQQGAEGKEDYRFILSASLLF